MNKWLKLLCEKWKDRKFAEKCGLKQHEICTHDQILHQKSVDGDLYKCCKCGQFYISQDK